MTKREYDEGASGKVILFLVLGVFPLVFMLLVFVFGLCSDYDFGHEPRGQLIEQEAPRRSDSDSTA